MSRRREGATHKSVSFRRIVERILKQYYTVLLFKRLLDRDFLIFAVVVWKPDPWTATFQNTCTNCNTNSNTNRSNTIATQNRAGITYVISTIVLGSHPRVYLDGSSIGLLPSLQDNDEFRVNAVEQPDFNPDSRHTKMSTP